MLAQSVRPKIAFINKSTVISNQQLSAIVAALQIQVDRDFAPAWYGYGADLSVLSANNPLPSDVWPIIVGDRSDQQGALGYHEELKDGRPVGYVFAQDVISDGDSVSVTCSHELLEMIGDPGINRVVESADGKRLYSFENCDACEDDHYAYEINGVKVSDFVTPAWFEMKHGTKGVYDFGRHIIRPFQLLPGGYIGMRIMNGASGWTQITMNREGDLGTNDRHSRRHSIRVNRLKEPAVLVNSKADRKVSAKR